MQERIVRELDLSKFGSCAAPKIPRISCRPICNFTPVARRLYGIGVSEEGFYQEILNTDSELFGGTNVGNGGLVSSRAVVVFRKR